MAKLLNRKTIQYIKQGQVLYGLKGLGIDINKFSDSYTSESSLRREIFDYIRNLSPNAPAEYLELMFKKIVDNYYVKDGSKYFKKTSSIGRSKLIERRLIPIKGYSEYFRDPQTGQLYHKRWEVLGQLSHEVYDPVNKDILDINGKPLLKAYENGNFGKYHTDLDVAYGNWKGQKIAVRYNKDSKTWMYTPVNGDRWIKADQDLSKYLNSLYSDDFTTTTTATNVTTPENTEGNTNTGNTGGNAGDNTNQVAPGAAPEGPPTSNFEALNVETDRRTIVPSVVSQLQVSQSSPSMRLLPKVKPVARPKDMPLMNRSDVRYTINDVTGDSPYFSSDIELVNGLAKTPDDNMFKQALMNRLGMDKWDNSTALNRLNYLGIKGNIGGSDRKRLRNLINKGTTIEGTIRKKQGGKLKLIKRYG